MTIEQIIEYIEKQIKKHEDININEDDLIYLYCKGQIDARTDDLSLLKDYLLEHEK